MDYYIQVLKKYAVFEGRASRKEFWMFMLFNMIVIIGMVLAFIAARQINVDLVFALLILLYNLAILLPWLCVTVRRLHDTNRSGWWLFIKLVPIIGPIILLVFLCSDSTPGDNRFGPNPKEIGQSI